MLLSEFLPKWLHAHAPEVKPATVLVHRTRILKHLVPRLGQVEVGELSPLHVRSLHGDLLLSGLSPRTVHGIHQTLMCAMNDAVEWEMLPKNPIKGVKPPRAERFAGTPLTAEQLRSLFAASASTRLHAAWVLLAGTGIRRGELLALRWSDLDLDNGVMRVARTWTKTADGVWVVGQTTKGNRDRTLALPAPVVASLRAHLVKQKRERLRYGPGYHNESLVFCRRDGKPLDPDALGMRFSRLLDSCGLPHVRIHDVRHTFATLALRSGVPLTVVSAMLGHSSVSITANLYQHVDLDMQRDAVNRIQDLIAV